MKKLFLILGIVGFLSILKISVAQTLFIQMEFYSNLSSPKLLEINFTDFPYNTFFTQMGYGNYSIKIFNHKGEVLYSEKFNVNFYLLLRTFNGSYMKKMNSSIKVFRLHLPENATLINFYYNNKTIFSLPLSHYLCNYNNLCEKEKGENIYRCKDCSLCGNNICESFNPYNENYKTCPYDCPSGEKDNYCDKVVDGKCDPDCKPEEDPDCTYEKNKLIVLTIIFGVGLIVLIILLKSFKIKREKGIEISY